MIDSFIRGISVDCCEHRSDVILTDTVSRSEKMVDHRQMHDKIVGRDLTNPSLKIGYVYDWGSPTNLTLKVMPGAIMCPHRHITILMQNVLSKFIFVLL
jgi:hypothetical protein